MNQDSKLKKALLINYCNPALTWQLFKRILSNPSPPSMSLYSSIPIVARILIRAKMLPEIDALHQMLLSHKCQSERTRYSLFNLVRILARSGLVDTAIAQFQSVRDNFPESPPQIYLYNILLESCIRENHATFVSWLCKDMILLGVPLETYTFNLLINGLCDLGRLKDARELFDKMPEKACMPNEYSVGILVRGYCRAGLATQALEILGEIRKFGLVPNKVVYNTLIYTFCKQGRTEEAERLVEKMREDGLTPDVVTFNSRISTLCSAGKMLEASRIFRDMQLDYEQGLPRPNNVTFNVMLEGFYKAGMLEEADSLVEIMKRDGMFTKLESYNVWLMGLVKNGKLLEAQVVLKEMAAMGIEPNKYSYSIVIDGLCKNEMISDARTLVGLMKSSGVTPDTVTYSILLHGYCRKGDVFFANNILNEMMRAGCFPNTYICNTLLHSLWKEGKVSEAESLLQKMNKRGYDLDIVTCNIVIDGLCRNGKLDKAMDIVDGMWTHGRAALGELGNLYIDLVDDSNFVKTCMPDLITYSTIIKGLCEAGRVDDARRKFIEMIGKDLCPDSNVYDIFIHTYCKLGKVSSAFRVLKEMEKRGYSKTLRTYNSLIMGLASKKQMFEIYGLLDEMRAKDMFPSIRTYNSVLACLCEAGQTNDATSLLDEMLNKGISPNVHSFSFLIKAFCREGEFTAAQEVFELALSVCGHKEALYSVMVNELVLGREAVEAKKLFVIALERSFYIGNFNYKDVINLLCKEEHLDDASDILRMLIDKGYSFDPAAFMPVVDELNKNGLKHEADVFSERMLQMLADGGVTNKILPSKSGGSHGKQRKHDVDWQTIMHRDDGSGIALKSLKRVEKGWGQGSILDIRTPKHDFVDFWDEAG